MSLYRRWYVYEVLDEHGACVYVGKGSGGRVHASLDEQCGVSARAIAYFNNEQTAFAFERDLLRVRRPSQNKRMPKWPSSTLAWVDEGEAYGHIEAARRGVVWATIGMLVLGKQTEVRTVVLNWMAQYIGELTDAGLKLAVGGRALEFRVV